MKKGLAGILNKLDDRDWVEKALDEAALKGRKPQKAIDYFYASWAGMCPRLIQYSMQGMIIDDINCKSRRIMDNGNHMHERYGDYFESIDRLVEREPAFKGNYGGVVISGRGDLIVKDDNGCNTLIELKSINSNRYKRILLRPDELNYLQWNLCAKALDFLSGIIFYENKDTQDIKYHFVSYSEDKYQSVINDFKEIDRCNNLGILVARPSVCPNPRWCSMKGSCK